MGNVQTTPGKAFGVNAAYAGFGDPTAILTGTWGATQQASGVVVSTRPTGTVRGRTTIENHDLAELASLAMRRIAVWAEQCLLPRSLNGMVRMAVTRT